MKIFLGADHGGFAKKEALKEFLVHQEHDQIEDCGAKTFQPDDDYPDFALAVAQQVSRTIESGEKDCCGILFCRSGSGMAIAANKVVGIRAVEIYDAWIAAHAKSHNQANVLCFAADRLSLDDMKSLWRIFQTTEIDLSARHQRRIAKIQQYELMSQHKDH